MPTNVVMPQMGESIAEGTIVRWIKKVGDNVDRDEPLFEISTDKVDAEIPSPSAGVLTEIKVKEGETVAVLGAKPFDQGQLLLTGAFTGQQTAQLARGDVSAVLRQPQQGFKGELVTHRALTNGWDRGWRGGEKTRAHRRGTV